MTAKLSFRKWLDLETIKKQFSEAAESGEFPDKVFSFLSAASVSVRENEGWQNTVFSLLKALKESQPDGNLPLLKDAPKDGKSADWEYEGRSWPFWSHLLAKSYGWTLEYIAELDVNEALARVQEILTDEHLEKEFVYSLSEVAYPYNKSTKKSYFKPMPRPYWMKPLVQPVKKSKMRIDMLPVGLVEDYSGMPSDLNPIKDAVQKKTEKTNAPPSP